MKEINKGSQDALRQRAAVQALDAARFWDELKVRLEAWLAAAVRPVRQAQGRSNPTLTQTNPNPNLAPNLEP